MAPNDKEYKAYVNDKYAKHVKLPIGQPRNNTFEFTLTKIQHNAN